MEKERGMEERQATPALQEFPQLRRLPFFSAQNQGFIADYLAHLRARYYAPSMQEATLRALKSFAVLMPKVRQAVLYEDLTQTTPADIDAWIEASFQQQLAPGISSGQRTRARRSRRSVNTASSMCTVNGVGGTKAS